MVQVLSISKSKTTHLKKLNSNVSSQITNWTLKIIQIHVTVHFGLSIELDHNTTQKESYMKDMIYLYWVAWVEVISFVLYF